METIQEYHSHDKTDWQPGPWTAEPDKVQGVDPDTGLDWLIVRNHGGALCGYVGVPESHPWFGLDYGQCTQKPPCDESYCGHAPGSRVEVHGGLTFADSCHEATPEVWERFRARLLASKDEREKYPIGDAARAWREGEQYLEDYEAWKAHQLTVSICHIPQEGRPDRVWWFGFDCAHSGDRSPGYGAYSSLFEDGDYRDVEYVKGEIKALARQIADVAS